MTTVPRRLFLAAVGVSALTSVAGCGNPNSTPMRMLTFRDVSVDETEAGWLVSLEVVNKNEASDELATFHGVKIHGFSSDKTELCSEEIGTVSGEHHSGNSISIEMTCSEFPTMLTYSAAESPCDDEVRTVIKIATYYDSGWSLERHARECDEGFPPEPRD